MQPSFHAPAFSVRTLGKNRYCACEKNAQSENHQASFDIVTFIEELLLDNINFRWEDISHDLY